MNISCKRKNSRISHRKMALAQSLLLPIYKPNFARNLQISIPNIKDMNQKESSWTTLGSSASFTATHVAATLADESYRMKTSPENPTFPDYVDSLLTNASQPAGKYSGNLLSGTVCNFSVRLIFAMFMTCGSSV